MPKLPANLTYNDLNGLEVREILVDWFRQLLESQPALQPHLTLPNAKINLEIDVTVEMFVGGTVPVTSEPEQLVIRGGMELTNNTNHHEWTPEEKIRAAQPFNRSTIINAAPVPGGEPPDQIRDKHSLPIPTPGYGPRETGSHLFIGDLNIPPQVPNKMPEPPVQSNSGGREGIVAEGYTFASEPAPTGKQVSVSGAIEQSIPVDNGAIEIDLTGQGRMRQGGIIVTAGTHRASAKDMGDRKGAEYGSVSGTYDVGPAGLQNSGRGGGLYRDGRSRISFGNNH